MVNDTTKYNWSALHLSVFHGYEKIFLWLMSEGGDVNQESQDGWDCLSLAIWQKNKTSNGRNFTKFTFPKLSPS